MVLRYDDLLTGDDITLTGVGHFRSPKMREMFPTTGIGWLRYETYLQLLRGSKEEICKLFGIAGTDADLFDMILYSDLGEAYAEALSFFMRETVERDPEGGCFRVLTPLAPSGTAPQYRTEGRIDRDNLDDVRYCILRMNYVQIERSDVHTSFASSEAEAAWNRIQRYQAMQEQHRSDGQSLSLGNMISKLCAIHPSINYFNVFDLTVFQFYDAFFQSAYLRSIEFSEAIVSTHGSEKFKYEDWMNPIQNS